MIISILGIYFNIFEIALLGFLLLFSPAIIAHYGTGVRLRSSKFFHVFLVASVLYLACILISIFGAVNESRVLKGFFKWIEILGFAVLIFLYVRSTNHFKKIYWIFWISNFTLILIALFSIFLNKHFVFQDRLFPDYPSAIALGLGFVADHECRAKDVFGVVHHNVEEFRRYSGYPHELACGVRTQRGWVLRHGHQPSSVSLDVHLVATTRSARQ